jgi:hypothetical protein
VIGTGAGKLPVRASGGVDDLVCALAGAAGAAPLSAAIGPSFRFSEPEEAVRAFWVAIIAARKAGLWQIGYDRSNWGIGLFDCPRSGLSMCVGAVSY